MQGRQKECARERERVKKGRIEMEGRRGQVRASCVGERMGVGKVEVAGSLGGKAVATAARQEQRIGYCGTDTAQQQQEGSEKGRREGRRPGMETTQGYGGQRRGQAVNQAEPAALGSTAIFHI